MTIVELMVAMVVFAIVMTSVAMTVVHALSLTRESVWREVAANVATAEMEQLRLADPADVPIGTDVVTRSTSLGEVRVERTAEWIPADSTADACHSPTDSPRDLLRVTIDVVAVSGDQPTSTTQSVLTPQVGTHDVGRGHVAVQVLDRDAKAPVVRPMIQVTGGPSNELRTGLASTEGCLFVDHLEPGDYQVEVLASGVDEQGGPLVAPAVVQAGAATPVQITYDEASAIEATFTSQPGALLPAGIDLVVRNTALLPDERQDEPGEGVTRTVASLFPFLSGYEVFAGVGQCDGVDPGAVGVARTLAEMTPGATTSVNVPLATVRLRTVNNGGNPVGGVTLSADAPSDDGCASGATLELGKTGAPNELLVAIPLGTWSFRPPGSGSTPAGPYVLDRSDVTYEVEVTVGG